jgi:hypothetical protein
MMLAECRSTVDVVAASIEGLMGWVRDLCARCRYIRTNVYDEAAKVDVVCGWDGR